MATEDAAGSGGPDVPDDEADAAVVAGAYSWGDLLREHGGGETARRLYEGVEPGAAPTTADWAVVDVDPSALLGFPPSALPDRLAAGDAAARSLRAAVADASAPDETPAAVGLYGWAEFEADVGATDRTAALGFPPDRTETALARASDAAADLADLVDERTVDVRDEIDEDDFFTDEHGASTIVTRYDLERAVPQVKKSHFREEERYWVNEPYAFVIVFHSTKENEKKYYLIEPHVDRIEANLVEFLEGKLRTAIKYGDDGVNSGDREERRAVIEAETLALLDRYDIYTEPSESEGLLGRVADAVGGLFGGDGDETEEGRDPAATLDGSAVRPEPAVLEEDPETLTEYQVEKLLYYLDRDFIGYERIDGIKHDVNVEDISCDGYDSPVFVYHSDYEQIISNVYHGETELDDFVVKLAQRSGKGISKRRPQVDATLPDGSRAQLTLGDEVSDHGTNYTIRQFKDVPFTPIDLINWNTFSLEEMAYLWLCIENHKSLIFAGGTASGKTTSLNAVSLFIPSNSKIVSIEDTREVELPQRNWIASVTRPSFSDDDKGDIDEFQLLEAALRQRPDYIVMGEVRGEEGRTLFQVMSTGHTTYTTFHADNVGEVLKRFTTDPINVSKTMFTALDLVSVQTATRVQGSKVRRNKSLTEINHYDAENDEINVQDVFQWQAETDEFLKMGQSNTLEEIKFDRGWTQTRLDRELFERRTVLAYLIDRGLNSYTQVAATFQAYINDPETILALIATDDLERSLEDLREMESVLIEVDPEHEAMVPRPDPDAETAALATEILERANEELLPEYADHDHEGIGSALVEAAAEADDVDRDRDEAAPDGAANAGGLDDALDLDPTAADGGTGADDEGVDDDPFAGAFAEANEDPDVLGSDDGDDDLDDWGFGEVSGGGGGGGG